MDEQQALASFNHAAEEVRFLRDYQWLITNYAMIAYSALVVGSLLVTEQRWSWRSNWGRSTWVSLLALMLIWLATWQAERVLWFTDDERNVARARLQAAVHRLPLVCNIRQDYPFKSRSERPWWVGFGKPNLPDPPPCGTLARPGAGEASQETDSGFPGRPGLAAAVLLGAWFASQIIILRIPPRLSPIRWLSCIERRWPVLVPVRRHWAVLVLEMMVGVALAVGFAFLFIPS